MRIFFLPPALLLAASFAAAQQPASPGTLTRPATGPVAGPVTCKAITPSASTPADVAFQNERYGEAETLFAAQVQAAPTEAVYTGLVETLIQENKFVDAQATAEKAVAALPRSSVAQSLAGDAYLRAAHLDQARTAFSAALTMDICNAHAHFGLARLLELSSSHASAQKELINAHKLDPADADISEALFTTLSPEMHAKGLRNLLSTDSTLSPQRRQRLEQEAWLLESGATCTTELPVPEATVPLYALVVPGVQGEESQDGNQHVHTRDYSLRASINGKSFVLDLDSTAPGLVLTQTDASKAKIEWAHPDQTPQTGLYGIARSIVVDKLHFRNCPVRVVPDKLLARENSIIGTSFFRSWVIELEWLTSSMKLTSYADPQTAPSNRVIPEREKSWSSMYVDGGRMLLPVQVDGQPGGLFVVDTSAVPTTLSPAAKGGRLSINDAQSSLHGVSGEFVRLYPNTGGYNIDVTDFTDASGSKLKLLRMTKPVTLVFAGVRVPVIDASSFDLSGLSHALNLETAGLVGFGTLRSFTLDIDYQNGLFHLNYDRLDTVRPGFNR